MSTSTGRSYRFPNGGHRSGLAIGERRGELRLGRQPDLLPDDLGSLREIHHRRRRQHEHHQVPVRGRHDASANMRPRYRGLEEVVAGQVFNGLRTSLRAGSASQVFARSGTASEGIDAGHRPEDRASVGHAFKIGGRAKARRRVRFPSASATEASSDQSLREEAGVGGRGEGSIGAPETASTTQVFRCSLRATPDESSDRPPEDRTIFSRRPLEGEE
jgi:hypothetical protein